MSDSSPTTDSTALNSAMNTVSERVMRTYSMARRVAISFPEGRKRAPSSKTAKLWRRGRRMAGEPNQVEPFWSAPALSSGGLESTPISTSSPTSAPVGSRPELPMKVRLPMRVRSRLRTPGSARAAPNTTPSAMKLSSPMSIRSCTTEVAVEISARRPTLAPSAWYQGRTYKVA